MRLALCAGRCVAHPRAWSPQAFIADIKALDGRDAWVVGRVVEGTGVARVVDGVEVLEV